MSASTGIPMTTPDGPIHRPKAGRCVDRAARQAQRVSVALKVDHRPGHADLLEAKVESVGRRLGG